MKIKKVGFLLSTLAFVIFFMGCGSSAHIEKDNTVNLSNYKTYTWIPKADSSGKNSKVINSIAEQNIRNSADLELQKNGFTKVAPTARPDLLLSYDVMVNKKNYRQSDPVYSAPYSRLYYNPRSGRYSSIYFPSQLMGYETSNSIVKEGTVTISMVDAKTDRTIWQGWSSDDIYNNFLTSKDAEKDVRSIFKKFNPSK
jgi:hypothetical protein